MHRLFPKLFLGTNRLCKGVELAGEGSLTNGATLFFFRFVLGQFSDIFQSEFVHSLENKGTVTKARVCFVRI